MKGSQKSFRAVLAAPGGAKSKFSRLTSASQRGSENCLISSGTATTFRFTKEIFIPLYYACESRRCLCRLCCHFQTKCFLVSCQLVPSCYTTHYRGNFLLTHPPRFGASILCFISVFQTWLRRLDSCPCWGSRRGLAGTGWRGSVGLWSPSRAPGGGAVPGRHDYSCSRSAGSAGRCASISFTSKLTRFWLPPWRLWQRCLRLQPPQLL